MDMKRQIIAMGGGGFSTEPDNLLLDEYFLQQTGKDCPKICFVPTASGDSDNYIRRFYDAFTTLECRPSHLSLFKPPTADLESFVLAHDAIYVGGGNTRNLLVLWREWGLDKFLRTAWENGVVLGGLSAGAICWFEQGVSDSVVPGCLTKLTGLGFLKGSFCPHYDGEPQRRPAYHAMVLANEMFEGMAAEDGVALHYVNDELARVVSSRPYAKAYSVRKKGDQIEEQEMKVLYLKSSHQAR